MSAHGERLELRLFLEGEELPVISATVQIQTGAPASAQVEIIPLDSALALLPRTVVHLFYLDSGARAQKEYGQNAYKLLFSGEVFSASYTKSGAGSRSVVLGCLDMSNIWDTNYVYSYEWTTDDASAIIGNQANLTGAGTELGGFDDIINLPQLALAQMANRTAANPSHTKTVGALGGLLSILESLGGAKGKYIGVNSWATIEEARVRLMDQVAADSGATSKAIYDLGVMENWLTDQLGSMGAVISFRDLMGTVFQYIYYDVVPNPVGMYVAGDRGIPEYTGLTSTIAVTVPATSAQTSFEVHKDFYKETLHPMAKVIEDAFRAAGADDPALIAAGISAAMTESGLDPTALGEVVYRLDSNGNKAEKTALKIKKGASGAASEHQAVGLFQLGTWIGAAGHGHTPEALTDPILNAELITQDRAFGAWTKLIATEQDVGVLSSEFSRMVERAHNATDAGYAAWLARNQATAGIYFPSWTAGPPISWADVARAETATAVMAAGTSTGPRERLITQIFRPDIWYAIPPICNVLFPEETSSWNFDRQMMREITRLQLTTHNTIYQGGSLLARYYWAPNFEEVESLTEGGIGSVARKIVYAHEKFSGIIPRVERMSDVSFYANLRDKDVTAQKELDLEAARAPLSASEAAKVQIAASETVVNEVEEYAARVAAYNFLTYRYASRNASWSGRFTPRLVCGFPGLFINRPIPLNPADKDQLPIHFLGMIRSVAHSLSQGGGTTSVSFTHVRSHKTQNGLDDLFHKEVFDKENVKLSLQSQGTRIKIVEGMDEKSFALAKVAQQAFSVDKNSTSFKVGSLNYIGPDGGKVVAVKVHRTSEPTVGAALVGTPMTFSFAEFTVIEDTGAPQPLEDVIRPSWVSEEYTSENIGSLYEELFGCTDLKTAAAAGSDIPESLEEAVDALVGDYTKLFTGGAASGWINGKTRRGTASIPQVLTGFVSGQTETGEDIVEPGFHRYAFGPYAELEHLDLNIQLESRLNSEIKEQTIPTELDPRETRRDRVLAYDAELKRSRGYRG